MWLSSSPNETCFCIIATTISSLSFRVICDKSLWSYHCYDQFLWLSSSTNASIMQAVLSYLHSANQPGSLEGASYISYTPVNAYTFSKCILHLASCLSYTPAIINQNLHLAHQTLYISHATIPPQLQGGSSAIICVTFPQCPIHIRCYIKVCSCSLLSFGPFH